MNIPRQQLTPAIVKAAQNHSTSGPVVQDAYVALDLSTVTPALPAPAINVCTNAIADIVRMRINIGIARMPASPQVDLQATNYFAKGSVLGAAGAIEKLKMVQCLLDLACVNAQRCAETSNNDERKNLQDAASFCGGSLKVILLDAKSPAAGAMDPIIKIHQVSPAAAEGIVRAAVGPLKTVFNQLTDPPKVTPRQQAATAP
jgi:hypothetical protein